MSVYSENKKIFHDYEILETFEAGLVLYGHEVKAIKTGKVSIKGAYVKMLHDEAYLIGATISPYQPLNTPDDYDEQRTRKLLLKKRELAALIGKSKEQRLTLVPIKLYNKKGKVKLQIGLARSKRKYDKREKIKEREMKRKKERVLKNY